jgi:Fe-S-cluster containining protein
VRYECQRCGACCRWSGPVRVEAAEIAALAAWLQLPEDEFIQRYTRLTADRRGLSLTEREDGACVFLQDRDCLVQPVKPRQCRDFPNGWNFPGFEHECRALSRVG